MRRVTTQSADQGLDRPATNDATAQALVRAIPDPIFRIGVDGVYRGFKVDNERDLLTPADQVIGHSVHERLPPHIAEGVLAAGRRAVEEGVLQRVEYSLEIHGELRDYEGRVVACGPDEFLLIVRDFTERTRQAQELERERGFSYAVVRSTPSFLALSTTPGRSSASTARSKRAAGRRRLAATRHAGPACPLRRRASGSDPNPGALAVRACNRVAEHVLDVTVHERRIVGVGRRPASGDVRVDGAVQLSERVRESLGVARPGGACGARRPGA